MYFENSHDSRDLPMPATPITESRCDRRSPALAWNSSLTVRSSGSRPQTRDARLGAECGDGLDELDGGPNGALGVILLRDGRPPDCHHGVADELLDRAAVAVDERSAGVEVAAQQFPNVVRVPRF